MAEKQKLTITTDFADVAEKAAKKRRKLLQQRARLGADLPLRFWNQQAQFTTPASGTPEKAIKGMAPVPKLLDRFAITTEAIAEASGAPLSIINEVLGDENTHSPFVMVDVEDAVALTEASIQKARENAARCFTQEDWGVTLPFYRPAGLRLESCIDDLLTVLPAVATGRTPDQYPVAGIVWPKAEQPEEIEWVCDLLGQIEKRLDLEENRIKIEFLVESAHGLSQVRRLAECCASRLAGIIWGIADYSADVNLPRIENDHPTCDWARAEIVNAAAAFRVPAIDNMTLNYPVPVHRGGALTDVQMSENRQKVLGALREVYCDALHGIALGMSGKWVGHPLQLLMVLAAYRHAIPKSQVDRDLDEIQAYSESVAAGAGATVLGDGGRAYMADRATDRHLRARLRRATAWGVLDPDKALELTIITSDEHTELTHRAAGGGT